MDAPSASLSSDLFESDDTEFLEALNSAVLSGDLPRSTPPLPPSPPQAVKRPRSPSPDSPPSHHHVLPALSSAGTAADSDADPTIYGASRFGHFGEYMRRKRAKLQIQNTHLDKGNGEASPNSQIFHGLAIYINGWTNPSIQELRQLILQHGGTFHAYLDRLNLVTHIVTNHLTPAKIREFQHRKVVRPDWLVESARRGILLPWTDFQWKPDEKAEPTQGTSAGQRGLDDFLVNQAPFPVASTSTAAYGDVPTSPVSHSSSSPPPPNSKPTYAAFESNPNAQRVMARPEWRATHTSMAPDFIEGYYKNSRLHHLSAWKAELRGLVAEAVERAARGEGGRTEGMLGDAGEGVSMAGAELMLRSPSKGKGKEKSGSGCGRVIMHCDFDCFFVSAGLVSRSHLCGKPVVVCHSQGATGGASSTSEIASASYEAREFGIRNGMSLQQARKLCPSVMTIPYEFERYKQFSLKFYTILMAHADDVQAVSVDEALIEATSSVSRYEREHPTCEDPARGLAELIRDKVREATGCEVSIGISHNILLARLATRLAKPARSHHLLPPAVPGVLAKLEIKDLHGFGGSAQRKAAEKLGTASLGELVKRSRSTLCAALGPGTGETLWKAVRGIDERKLEGNKPRQSVSCDITYGVRFDSIEQVETFLFQMAEEVARRLDAIDMRGRSLTLKVMKRDPSAPVEAPKFLGHGQCEAFNKQAALLGPGGRATNDARVIYEHAWRLFKAFDFDPKELRGFGIQITKLEGQKAVDGTENDPAQAVLPFRRIAVVDALKGKAPEREALVTVHPPSQEDIEGEEGVPFHAHRDPQELPSLSQIDMDVYAALPEYLRQELDVELRRRSKSPVPGPSRIPAPAPRIKVEEKPLSTFLSKGPRNSQGKEKGKQPNVKRITQQLAPRNRPVLASFDRNPLFRARQPEAATDAELRELDIDPDVFAMLPAELQREQLAMARRARNAGGTARFIGERRSIKPYHRHSRSPSVPYRRQPLPSARYLPRPTLKQQGKAEGEKLCFSETEDVQGVIGRWVTGFRTHPPNEKDVAHFERFLVRCVEEGGDAGVERAVKVAKWWLLLLRRYWGEWEGRWKEDDGDTPEAVVGRAWWRAFWDVKGKMDLAARKRFGGSLSLK